MKKFLLPIIVLMAVFLPSCKGDVNTDLKGKTFTYWNGEFGSWNITSTYEFQNTGNVYHELQIGYSGKYDTDGCSLYYKMNGDDFTIYHGTRGWKKEVQKTVYATGTYYRDYIVVDGDIYYLE